jgi:hypothetical protein
MGEVTQAGRRDEPVAANERAGRREERRELLRLSLDGLPRATTLLV